MAPVGLHSRSFPEFSMLHYSCDLCKRAIDPHAQARHVVKIEVFQALDDEQACECDEADATADANHLDEMEDMLERLDDTAAMLDAETHLFRFDLCDDCRRRFLRNPLGVKPGKQLDFSNN
jgi:hypothetical protein